MTWMEFFIAGAWKSTAILLAAFAAAFALRGAAAAVRHFVWSAAFGLLLLLPATMLVAPRWDLEPVPLPVATVVVAGHQHATPVPRRPVNWLPILWLAGCTAAAARFLLGAARTSWMVRHAAESPHTRADLDLLRTALGIRRRVRVLESPAAPVPLAWGIFRPVVLLPRNAGEWPAPRLGAVLLHELAHVQRLDLVAQAVAQAACCWFWFHPLVWIAARRLRQERERACDDAVLLRGVTASEYAGHLMELARGLAAQRQAWSDAPAMAEPSDLESRVRALLDRGRRRHPLSRRAALAIAAAGVAVLLPVAAITAFAQVVRGALVGVVIDPSGARIPGCKVTAKNLDGPNEELTVANAAGEYRFTAIPPGRYALQFATPGFSALKLEAVVNAGQAARVDAAMEIGGVSESVTIRAARTGPAPVPPASNGVPQRIRVGGNVKQLKLIRQVRPNYPDELKQLGVEGTVVVRAIIGKDGTVLSPRVVNTEVDPRLAEVALDAVRQWLYEPTLLNGQPVEALTTVTLDFRLDQ